MKTGEVIREIRKQQKKTQKEFAEMLEISPSYLSELENGKRKLNISTIEKISKKLHVSPHYLMTGNRLLMDLSSEEKERLKKEHYNEMSIIEMQKIDNISNFLSELDNNRYDVMSLKLINEIVRLSYIKKDREKQNPVTLRKLQYIINLLNNFYLSENETMSEELKINLMSQFESILKK